MFVGGGFPDTVGFDGGGADGPPTIIFVPCGGACGFDESMSASIRELRELASVGVGVGFAGAVGSGSTEIT